MVTTFDRDELERLGGDGVMRALAPRARCPDHPDATDDQRELLVDGLAIIERAEDVLGPQESLGTLKSIMLGKLGRFADAVANARERHARAPTWSTAVALGGALRRAQDADGAVAAFREAAAIDPSDVTALLDAGDLLLAREQWDAAAAAYGEALAREPDHAWAAPSACYARYRAGDAAALESLQKMARGRKDECGVAGILSQMGMYTSDDRLERAQYLLEQIPGARAAKPKKKAAPKKQAAPKKKAKTKAKVKAKAKPTAKAKAKPKPKARAKRRSR